MSWSQVCQFVDSEMESIGVPGIAIGILHEDERMTAGFGVTNVLHPLPVTKNTLFQIGSITKTYTCLAILRLVEIGALNLDDRIHTHWIDFKVADEEASNKATVRHLLTHTGGWEGDFFIDTGAGADALAKYVYKMANLEQLAPIGKIFSYSNSGFDVAGYIIEKITGQSFETAMQELVLDPLGLDTTYFFPTDVMVHRFVVGHHATKDGSVVAGHWPLPRHAYPDGGIVCDVNDLLNYAKFHLGDNIGKFLKPASLAAMWSPQENIWGEGETVGYAWFINQEGGTRQLWSSGVTNGQNAFLRLIPEHNFAIAILTNSSQGYSVIEEVDRVALKTFVDLETASPTPIEISSIDTMTPYVGCYVRPFSEIELSIQDRKLIGRITYKQGYDQFSPPSPSPPPMSLAFCEKDRLLVLDGPFKGDKAEFVRKSDGSIGWLRASRRLHKRTN